MKRFIKELLAKYGIDVCGTAALSECRITKEYLLTRAGICDGSVIMFAIPYYSEISDTPERNISAYAVCRDYHAFCKKLSEDLTDALSKKYPDNRFAVFADHSPIDERAAALRCGIGFIGDNGLIVNEKYSSYIFLGEIVTDTVLDSDPPVSYGCLHCGLCKKACPMVCDGSLECLSAITQKKGVLSDFEISLMKKHNTLWGCDICQEVCPYTKKARSTKSIYTKIDYFKEDTIAHLRAEDIEKMSDDEFLQRAYSWRGRSTILRNLLL